MTERVTDPTDERLADYFSLTDVALRRKLDTERGLYLAESDKVIRRALSAGHLPRSFLMGERWAVELADLVAVAEDAGVPVYVGTDDVITAMTGFHLHRGAIASMHRPEPTPFIDVLAHARRVVVLEDIVDHTNVGAIFRSAAALGVDAVLVTPAAQIRSIDGAFGCPWGPCFRCPGRESILGQVAWRRSRRPGSR